MDNVFITFKKRLADLDPYLSYMPRILEFQDFQDLKAYFEKYKGNLEKLYLAGDKVLDLGLKQGIKFKNLEEEVNGRRKDTEQSSTEKED